MGARAAWREALETWPHEWRRRHTARARRLEAEGVFRQGAEYLAYDELEAEAIRERDMGRRFARPKPTRRGDRG